MSDWYEHAACRGRPTDWWYPRPGDRFAAHVAVMVCRGCPVRAECLAAALAEEAHEGVAHGVRGGYTAQARVKLRRRRDSCDQSVTTDSLDLYPPSRKSC